MKIKLILLIVCIFALNNSFADITLYSYRQEYLIKPIIDLYKEKTGKDVKVLFAKKGLVERIKREGKKTLADGILTTDITELIRLEKENLLSPMNDSKELEQVSPAYRSSKNLWTGLSKRARILYVSKERVKEGEIKDYEDIIKDKWRGKICTRSGKHNYNISLFSSLYAHHKKDKMKDFLVKLKANLARRPKGNDRAQIRAIAAGVCDISIGNSYYYGIMVHHKDQNQRDAAKKVNLVFPNQGNRGSHINISGVAIMKHSSNKKEMNQFISFLLSDEVQKLYAELNYEFPINDHIKIASVFNKYYDNNKFDPLPIEQIYTYRKNTTILLDEIKFDF